MEESFFLRILILKIVLKVYILAYSNFIMFKNVCFLYNIKTYFERRRFAGGMVLRRNYKGGMDQGKSSQSTNVHCIVFPYRFRLKNVVTH